MTARDPLANRALRPDRVSYATGALLGSDDFTAEQTYHRARLARALAYLHGTGTVAGLAVRVDPPAAGDGGAADGDRVTVKPGMALDPLGRMVEVTAPSCLRLGRWLRSQSALLRETGYLTRAEAIAAGVVPADPAPPWTGCFVVDVFAAFHQAERGLTPSFASGPYEALDAVSPSRLRDDHELTLLLRQEDQPPVPELPWGDVPVDGTPEDRIRALHQAMLDRGWTEGTEFDDELGVRRLPEHALTQNGTEVLLSRMVVPAVRPSVGERADGASQPAPVRDAAFPVTWDDHVRRFVHPGPALAWLTRQESAPMARMAPVL
jgi:hypothetical protein